MAISRTQVPKPENHQDFERLCAVLWGEKLQDPNIQRYGRSGTEQDGIDIIGKRDGDARKRVGIQCKLKSGKSLLTEKEFVKEFEKALKIDPALTEFHIVTTADRDPELQNVASRLEIRELDKGRRITVGYWGWQAITDELGQYPKALLAFDDSAGVFGLLTLDRVNTVIGLQQSGQEALLARLDVIATRLPPSDTTVGIATAIERHLDAEIDSYRDANNEGSPSVSLTQFSKMLERVLKDDVSGRILFRIKANIGSCHLRLGDDPEAIKWLLEAFDHAPTEPKAIANKALAHLLMEDFETVLAMGAENLKTEAADERLSSHVIQAARFADLQGDPLVLVPEKDRDSEGVLIALTLLQRSRGDARWKENARTLLDRVPEEKLARQLSAEALLDDVLGGSGYIDYAGQSEEDRSRLAVAAKSLQALWDETVAAEGKYDEADIALCGNLILAYRAQADFPSALALLRHALTIPEIDDEFIVRAAATAMEAGDNVIDEILPRLPAGQSKNLLTLQLVVRQGKWEELAKFGPEEPSAFPSSDWQICRTAIRLGRLWIEPDAQSILALPQIINDIEGDVRSNVVVAGYCKQKGFQQLADRAWEGAMAGITSDTHISGRLMAAMYAYKNRLWSAVCDLMYGYVSVDRDGDELRSLATALVQERPIKKRAVEFFESLPDEIISLERYRYLCGMMHFNRGDMPAAEQIFQKEMETHPSLELLVMQIMVRRRQNRNSEIPDLLSQYDIRELDGSAAEKMQIAHELRRVGRYKDAVDFAYPVLRANPNDADINVSFAVLIFQVHDFGQLVSVSEVASENWVRLTREGDKDYSFVIGEGQDNPTGGFLTPSHQLAALSLGKHIGDTLLIPQPIGDPIVWTVAEIKHRYLHAFHDILDNFQTKFPNAKGLYSVTMKEGDLSSIIDQLKKMAERGDKAIDLHVESGFPIQLVAGLFDENPLELAGGIAEEHDIKTCLGNGPEQVAAHDLIQGHAMKGVVLDAHAAWTAATLDILDLIAERLGPILLPQSSLDSLLQFRGYDDFQKYPAMSLFHRRNQTYRQERDRETDEARQGYVDQQIAKIEAACIISPVVAPNDISSLEAAFLENCGERGFDPIFLSMEGRMLLSEDLTYRQLAKQTRQVEGIWIQALLRYARLDGTISEERYADAVADLALLRHGPVSVDPSLIRTVVARDASRELRGFEALSRYIGGPGADYLSHARVVQQYIRASAKQEDIAPLIRQRVVSSLLRNLVRLSGKNWPWVIDAVDERLAAGDRDYLRGWLKGHFLNPRILDLLQLQLNAYISKRLLADLREDTGTSPIETILGREFYRTPLVPRFTAAAPENPKRPAIPRKKRGRKRRR